MPKEAQKACHERTTANSPPKNSKYETFEDLSRTESLFYHLFYMGAAGYALYCFYLHSQKNKNRLPLAHQDSWFGPYQDQNDLEWNVFFPLTLDFTCYGLLHLVLTQIIRHILPQLLLPFYIIFSSLALIKILGLIGALLCLSIPLVMFVALYSKLKVIIWLCWCLILVIFNTEQFSHLLIQWLSDITDGEYKAAVIAAWIILRSLSFALDSCEGGSDPQGRVGSSLWQLVTLLAYCFYFPLLFTGPFMPFCKFQEGVKKPALNWNFARFLWLFGQLARFSLWMLLNDVLLYYFYAHCHQFSSSFTSRMDSWMLGGFVYTLLLFFLLKYVVYYGMMAVLAKAEGFEPPRHPRCVLLVRRFSYVWRHFDQGLYLFMTRHIYFPFLGEDRSATKKAQASVIVFIFVYVWHGASPSMFWWSTLSFFCLVLEKTSQAVYERSLVQVQGRLSGRCLRRLVAAVDAFAFLLSVVSLVVFLSSVENAVVVFKMIFLKGFPLTTATTLFIFYCIVQCGIDVDKWRRKERDKRE